MKSVYFIPVYNQIEELPKVLSEFKSVDLPCDTLLFINDGSTDGSDDLIRKSGYFCLNNDQRMGLGYSYIKALDWALQRSYELFGTFAANGKMLPAEMSRVMGPIVRDEVDYVTGSRFLEGGDSPNLPGFRRHTIPMVNLFVRLLTGIRLTDATCGYRALRLDIIRRADFDWHKRWMYTYAFEYYLYAKVLLSTDIRWKEVPITMQYPPKGKRYSKISPFKDWYAMLKPWVIARIDGKGFRVDSHETRRR
ncbi:MAG: glycosyltransferase family 2 protein [Nitrospirae bacterium]|nr:glycosyltransferase family 2 protein [Nitrospirota bacterium]